MRLTVECVRSRVEPPAPYVTATKLGLSGASRVIDSHNVFSLSSVFGGKNSKETRMRRGSPPARTKRLARGSAVIRQPPAPARQGQGADRVRARARPRSCLRK